MPLGSLITSVSKTLNPNLPKLCIVYLISLNTGDLVLVRSSSQVSYWCCTLATLPFLSPLGGGHHKAMSFILPRTHSCPSPHYGGILLPAASCRASSGQIWRRLGLLLSQTPSITLSMASFTSQDMYCLCPQSQ